MSGGKEHASHVAMEGDTREETPIALQKEQGPAKEPLEEMGKPDGTVHAAGTLPAESQDAPANSQDEVTVNVTEEIRGLDKASVGAEDNKHDALNRCDAITNVALQMLLKGPYSEKS